MELAMNGGPPVRTKPFPKYVTVGEEEKKAICEVIDSGCLSKYLGTWHPQFYGGEQVQLLEAEWAKYFGVKHAVAVNSNTSGLYCVIGAIGTEPLDEIIVSPYTMSASSIAPLIYNAIPVFSDIEEDMFCLDADLIEDNINDKTRAIIVVDIFGQPYNRNKINQIAKKHGLYVIEDSAQAPGATFNNSYCGILGDVGVFSLNYHKHIQCGEGGIIVTNDDEIAERCRLIRNHAESVVGGKNTENLTNMIGYNFRMTEIEAAISRIQLKKLEDLNTKRLKNVKLIEEKLSDLSFLTMPVVRNKSTHVYYQHAIKYNKDINGLHRDVFINAVRSELPHHELREEEGPKIGCGYVKPIYLLPLFQQKIAYGKNNYPFMHSSRTYDKGDCPVAERMFYQELFTHEFMLPSMDETDIDDVANAFYKVWEHRNLLA